MESVQYWCMAPSTLIIFLWVFLTSIYVGGGTFHTPIWGHGAQGPGVPFTTSIWIAIVQTWIQPRSESLLHIFFLKNWEMWRKKPKTLLSVSELHQWQKGCTRLFPVPFHVEVFVSPGACMVPTHLCQSLLFWLVAKNVGAAIHSNYNSSWRPTTPRACI